MTEDQVEEILKNFEDDVRPFDVHPSQVDRVNNRINDKKFLENQKQLLDFEKKYKATYQGIMDEYTESEKLAELSILIGRKQIDDVYAHLGSEKDFKYQERLNELKREFDVDLDDPFRSESTIAEGRSRDTTAEIESEDQNEGIISVEGSQTPLFKTNKPNGAQKNKIEESDTTRAGTLRSSGRASSRDGTPKKSFRLRTRASDGFKNPKIHSAFTRKSAPYSSKGLQEQNEKIKQMIGNAYLDPSKPLKVSNRKKKISFGFLSKKTKK